MAQCSSMSVVTGKLSLVGTVVGLSAQTPPAAGQPKIVAATCAVGLRSMMLVDMLPAFSRGGGFGADIAR